jgi:hypothetical protein
MIIDDMTLDQITDHLRTRPGKFMLLHQEPNTSHEWYFRTNDDSDGDFTELCYHTLRTSLLLAGRKLHP